jgi:hypothetical protein
MCRALAKCRSTHLAAVQAVTDLESYREPLDPRYAVPAHWEMGDQPVRAIAVPG